MIFSCLVFSCLDSALTPFSFISVADMLQICHLVSFVNQNFKGSSRGVMSGSCLVVNIEASHVSLSGAKSGAMSGEMNSAVNVEMISLRSALVNEY